MFSDNPSRNPSDGTDLPDSVSEQEASSLPPSVKIYKPEIHSGTMKTISSSWHKPNTETSTNGMMTAFCAEADVQSDSISDTADELATVIAVADLPDTPAAPADESLDGEDGDADGLLLSDDREEESAAMPEPIPAEEPVPSLFIGIGRTDWSQPFDDGPTIVIIDEETDGEAKPEELPPEAEPAEEEPEEETIDVDELLYLIDDIEFAGMDPEPLRAVQYVSTKGDPYNTAFNDPEQPGEEPGEFSVDSGMKFEKK